MKTLGHCWAKPKGSFLWKDRRRSVYQTKTPFIYREGAKQKVTQLRIFPFFMSTHLLFFFSRCDYNRRFPPPPFFLFWRKLLWVYFHSVQYLTIQSFNVNLGVVAPPPPPSMLPSKSSSPGDPPSIARTHKHKHTPTPPTPPFLGYRTSI